jgi:hypothetical protein
VAILIVGNGERTMKSFNQNHAAKVRTCAILIFISLQSGLAQEINWYSMDSGGGVATANGIELLGVIGQTDTTQLSAGEIKLSGGYLPLPDTSDVIFKDSFD